MSHTCHAHECPAVVPPSMFACRPHWWALRKPMRDAIWREYRPGQEDVKNPSLRYMAVQRRAVGELAFRPRDEKAAAIAAVCFLESELWRARASEAGRGDPLEGLSDAPLMSVKEVEGLIAAFKSAMAASVVEPSKSKSKRRSA